MKPKLVLSLALPLAALISSSASAEVLSGQVNTIGPGQVYLRISPTTVAKIPTDSATFRRHGERVAPAKLLVGQHVVVEYSPVHGLQQYYHTSSVLEGSGTVFDPNDTSSLDGDGDLYQPVEP